MSNDRDKIGIDVDVRRIVGDLYIQRSTLETLARQQAEQIKELNARIETLESQLSKTNPNNE